MQASREKALKSKDYCIEFNKLRMGSNTFEFILGDAFFAAVEGSTIEKANVKVSLELLKSEHIYDLNFVLSGTVAATCDNCLDEFELPIENEFHLVMKMSESEDYSDDEIIYITKNLLEYDFSQYLYESLVLSLPPRAVCDMADKTCNTEIVTKISNYKHEDENKTETDNPVWDKLKGIFNNN